jgi:transaldolase / glucose-6-phosphate isomerase
MAESLPALQQLAAELRAEADRVVVVGAGGAALSAELYAGAFPPVEGFPRLSILDSTEPSAVAAAASALDPARTVFVVSSRTGSTLETSLLFDFLWDAAVRRLGDEAAARRFVFITEQGSALATEAAKRRARALLPADPGTPAVFGPLSSFGLVPAALSGWNVGEVLERARAMAEACRTSGAENPGLLLGAALGAEALGGCDKLTFCGTAALRPFETWIEALIASATGKEGKGIVPVGGEPLGGPEVYGSDRFFARLELADAPDTDADHRLATLVEHGHPMAGFVLKDPLDLGAEIFRWQFAAAVAGRMLAVNPFDEPDLADGRARISRILSGSAAEASVGEAASADAFSRLLASIRSGDYLAISAFLPQRPSIEGPLEVFRLAVRKARRVATTLGFGARGEHIAGQLHKGGTARGAFLQLTGQPAGDVAIPGRPWGFATVFAAQADADLEALSARRRRAARVFLGADLEKAITGLAASVERESAA